jgi:alpha-glucosidase (family GH31 glycosyl hydrolase)
VRGRCYDCGVRTARLVAPLLLSTLGLACSSTDPDPPPVDARVGAFSVRLAPSPLRLSITTPSGRLVFDGLGPADVPPQTDEVDPPPLTGLALRDVTTKVESSFGSFQLTDVGAWHVGRSAANVVADGTTLRFDAVDGARGEGETIAHVELRADHDAELAIVITPAKAPGAGARTWASLASKCQEGDRFLGFGDQERDAEHRGQTVPIFVSEPGVGKRDDDSPTPIYFIAGTRHASSFPLPLFVAESGFAGVVDGAGRSLFSMCSERADVLRVSGDAVTGEGAGEGGAFVYRILDAPTPKDAARLVTAHWGRPRIPPRLAFGVWNDAIFGSASVRAFAEQLRDADVPSSAIWTEDFRGGAFVGDSYKLSEEWDFDPTLYPDPAQVAADLRASGFAWLLYFNTFVEQDNSVWKEAQPKGYLVAKQGGAPYVFDSVKQKPTGMVDLTNEAARAWMTAKLKAVLAIGAAGWMGDYGEWLPLDAKLADGSDPWATHDRYPQLWQDVQRAALDANDVGGVAPGVDERVSFVRSGWLGSTPKIDVFWPGDQRTDLEPDDGLPTIIPQAVGLSFAGVSTYGSDIAGYQSATNPPADKETFFRWTELGAWSPVMRTHHGTAPKKQWRLDSDAETLAHFRKYAILHQQLLPNWERLAKEAHDTGVTIWRHLATEFPADPNAWTSGYDEVMVGDSILIAPVIEKGATSRSVYLPAGAAWFAFGGDAPPIEGGKSVIAQAALGEIPVFVRAGAIVTMLPDRVRTVLKGVAGVTTVEDVKDDRVLLVTAGPDARVTEVSGLSYALAGASALALPAGTATWNGAPLATCATPAVAPCVAQRAGHASATLKGPGVLALDGATLTTFGGDAARAITVELSARSK